MSILEGLNLAFWHNGNIGLPHTLWTNTITAEQLKLSSCASIGWNTTPYESPSSTHFYIGIQAPKRPIFDWKFCMGLWEFQKIILTTVRYTYYWRRPTQNFQSKIGRLGACIPIWMWVGFGESYGIYRRKKFPLSASIVPERRNETEWSQLNSPCYGPRNLLVHLDN